MRLPLSSITSLRWSQISTTGMCTHFPDLIARPKHFPLLDICSCRRLPLVMLMVMVVKVVVVKVTCQQLLHTMMGPPLLKQTKEEEQVLPYWSLLSS